MATLDSVQPRPFDPAAEEGVEERVAVLSTDLRRLGHVEGFVVDDDERVTHVVVHRTDLSGARELKVPVEDVLRVGVDSITLDLTTEAVGLLPAVPVEPWALWRRADRTLLARR